MLRLQGRDLPLGQAVRSSHIGASGQTTQFWFTGAYHEGTVIIPITLVIES